MYTFITYLYKPAKFYPLKQIPSKVYIELNSKYLYFSKQIILYCLFPHILDHFVSLSLRSDFRVFSSF